MMLDAPESGFGDFVDPFEVAAPEKTAPQWPFFLGTALLVLSGFLVWVGFSQSDTTLLAISVIGYILTPLATAAVLILAMRSHRDLSSVNGYLADSGTKLVKKCAYVAGIGFVFAAPHVWQISDFFALLFAPRS